MLIHKAALIAGALVVTGAATMAQATELGARSIVIDSYDNQRALEEQAENRAYQAQFKAPRPGTVAYSGRITQRDALDIARAQGVSDVEGVRQQRDMWLVDGTNLLGQNLTVHLDARGQVLDVQHG